MNRIEQEHQIIARIYDTILDPLRWKDVLTDIINYTDSFSGMFTLLDQLNPEQNFIYTHNLPDHVLKAYQNEEIRTLDMRIHQPKLKQAGIGSPTAYDWSHYADMPGSDENILYERCMQPINVRYGLATLLEESKYRWVLLSTHRTWDKQPYSHEDDRCVARFATHIQRALQVAKQFHLVQQQNHNFQQMMDCLHSGVVLLNHQSRLVYANKAATQLLNDYSILWLDHFSRLKTYPQFQNQLNQYIYSICSRFNPELNVIDDKVGGVITLYEQPDQPTLKLSIMPFLQSQQQYNEQAKVLIFITVRKQTYQLETLYLSKEYHLSKREIEICEFFINGYNLEEIAERLDITLSSLRTYFKYIYEKTHCSSQIELMHFLMSITFNFEHIT